ncbi:hypothetical protein GobsT_41810 [Gemmata obscuriglobus]|nr:hypothetical protein GobsT_41810 [Gemmata obscuriglobus]VTS08443.1 unnamed protein product [Gemmata obscuriglobus UQM 2246]
MTERGIVTGDRPSPRAAEVVELVLLLPADQMASLETAAGRLEQTVGALIRRAVDDFLRDPAATGFVGEVAAVRRPHGARTRETSNDPCR